MSNARLARTIQAACPLAYPHDPLSARDPEAGPQTTILDEAEAWRRLEARATAEDHGLRLGASLPPEALFPGLHDAPSLRVALDRLCRTINLRRPWEELRLTRMDDVWLLQRRHLDGRALMRRQEAELALLGLARLLRRALGPGWRPIEVQLQHCAPQDSRPHRAAFGAPVIFGMGCDALVIDAPSLRLPVTDMPETTPPAPQGIPTPLMQTAQIQLRDRVKSEIRQGLSEADLRIERVAEALRTTRWTLQRRLGAAGEVFSDLVDETRRDLVMIYLPQMHLSFTDIAGLLGYSELSALTRACSRWFGAPPSRLRAGLALPAPASPRPAAIAA